MRLLLFSDYLRWVKFGLAFMIVVAYGIYYNMNRSGEFAGLNSYGLYLEEKSNGNICLQIVKIIRKDGQLLAVTRNREFNLLNLPESVQNNFLGDYAIRGKIVKENYLIIESIRGKHSRFLKLAVSSITATIICILFFVFFRLSSKGFLPKPTD